MITHLQSKIFLLGLLPALLVSSGCDGIDRHVPPKRKGVVAVVYTDLTKSIDTETANRQKQNIGDLFQKLPENSQFYLFSIDRGTNKPSIYEFKPNFTEVKDAETEDKLEEEIKEAKTAKEGVELKKLQSSLDSYQTAIDSENGNVSCISNKLNSLADMIASKRESFPQYEIRVYFYSDMIEQCQNSFDGKLLNFEKYPNDGKEEAHLQDIQNRIEKNFQPASPDKDLKSLGTKVYIILTSQDDKQSLRSLKAIWNNFFGKLGLAPQDIHWTNGNENYFWTLSAGNTNISLVQFFEDVS